MLKDQQLLKRNKDFFSYRQKNVSLRFLCSKCFDNCGSWQLWPFFSVWPHQSEVDYEVLENIQIHYFSNLYHNTYYHDQFLFFPYIFLMVKNLLSACHYNLLLITNRSWILTLHKGRIFRKNLIEKTFLTFKKWVKII